MFIGRRASASASASASVSSVATVTESAIARLLHFIHSSTLALIVVLPGAAAAGWGDEKWGEMVWGLELVPTLTHPGIVVLVVSLLFTARHFLVRRRRLANGSR